MDDADRPQLDRCEDGFLSGKRFLIHDRDPLFTAESRETLAAAGVESVRLPARSPNLNAYAERFVRTIKESCLERMILFGEPSLRRVTREFLAHYHRERNHQGLDNRLIFPGLASTDLAAPIERRQRLGGMLNYYYRQAAFCLSGCLSKPLAVGVAVILRFLQVSRTADAGVNCWSVLG